jgi:hypothetical protein
MMRVSIPMTILNIPAVRSWYEETFGYECVDVSVLPDPHTFRMNMVISCNTEEEKALILLKWQ